MASNTPIPELPKWTFLGGDGRLARRVGKPVRRFLHVEASGGVVLLLAAIISDSPNSVIAESISVRSMVTFGWTSNHFRNVLNNFSATVCRARNESGLGIGFKSSFSSTGLIY